MAILESVFRWNWMCGAASSDHMYSQLLESDEKEFSSTRNDYACWFGFSPVLRLHKPFTTCLQIVLFFFFFFGVLDMGTGAFPPSKVFMLCYESSIDKYFYCAAIDDVDPPPWRFLSKASVFWHMMLCLSRTEMRITPCCRMEYFGR